MSYWDAQQIGLGLRPTAPAFAPKSPPQSQEEDRRSASSSPNVSPSLPANPPPLAGAVQMDAFAHTLFARGNVFLDGWR